jgi:hypothetical protein
MNNELKTILALSAVKRSKCWRERITDPELGKVIDEALAHPDITASAVTIWLKQKGVTAGQNIVSRHRRGDCACNR